MILPYFPISLFRYHFYLFISFASYFFTFPVFLRSIFLFHSSLRVEALMSLLQFLIFCVLFFFSYFFFAYFFFLLIFLKLSLFPFSFIRYTCFLRPSQYWHCPNSIYPCFVFLFSCLFFSTFFLYFLRYIKSYSLSFNIPVLFVLDNTVTALIPYQCIFRIFLAYIFLLIFLTILTIPSLFVQYSCFIRSRCCCCYYSPTHLSFFFVDVLREITGS